MFEQMISSPGSDIFYSDNPGSAPVRVSMSDYRNEEWLTNIPLYAAERILG